MSCSESIQDVWHDVDVFQTYRSKHHRYLDFTSDQVQEIESKSKWWQFACVSVLLAFVGVATAGLTVLTDVASGELDFFLLFTMQTTERYAQQPQPFQGRAKRRVSYVLFCLICAVGAACVTHFLCPAAAGSGVPEMKTILSGVVKSSLLTPRALLAKVTGLTLSLGAGLSVGKEGPNVHIACALAEICMRKFRIFRAVAINQAKRIDVLGAACAAGVAASFGTPFGGAIFSIEITATSYNIHMLPQALWCCLAGALALQSAGLDSLTSIFDPDTNFQNPQNNQSTRILEENWMLLDLLAFVVLGAVCGLLGCIFVWLVSSLAARRNEFLSATATSHFHWTHKQGLPVRKKTLAAACGESFSNVLARKLILVVCATILVASLVFEDLMNGLAAIASENSEADDVLDVLFAKSAMDAKTRTKVFWFVPYKLLTTILSVVLPLPVGVFKPTFVCGAAIGRAVGEVLHGIATNYVDRDWLESLTYLEDTNKESSDGVMSRNVAHTYTLNKVGQPLPVITQFLPWEYAVIGAAAFAAGVTRALSTAVIFLELAGENHLRTPLLVSTLVAHFIGNRFTKPIYDAIIDTNGTPTLPDLPARCYYLPARAVMTNVSPIPDLSAEVDSICTGRHHYSGQGSSSSRSSRSSAEAVQSEVRSFDLISCRPKRKMREGHLLQRSLLQRSFLASSTRAFRSFFDSKHGPRKLDSSLRDQKFYGSTRRDEVIKSQRFTDETALASSRVFYHTESSDKEDFREPRSGVSFDNCLRDEEILQQHASPSISHELNYDSRLKRDKIPGYNDHSKRDDAIPYLCLNSTYAEIRSLLKLRKSQLQRISSVPVVQNSGDPALVGAVLLDDLASAVKAFDSMLSSLRRSPTCGGSPRSDSASKCVETTVNSLSLNSSSDSFNFSCLRSPLRDPSGITFPDINVVRDPWQAVINFVINHGGRAVPVASSSQQNLSHLFAVMPDVSVLLDTSPYQILDTMDLAKVDLIFRTLKVSQAYVTCSGVLVGVITRARLRKVLAHDAKEPLDRCRYLCCGTVDRKGDRFFRDLT